LLAKARLFGTNRPPIDSMEHRLMLTLYWRTALRVPKACFYALLRRLGGKSRYTLFVNPYLEEQD